MHQLSAAQGSPSGNESQRSVSSARSEAKSHVELNLNYDESEECGGTSTPLCPEKARAVGLVFCFPVVALVGALPALIPTVLVGGFCAACVYLVFYFFDVITTVRYMPDVCFDEVLDCNVFAVQYQFTTEGPLCFDSFSYNYTPSVRNLSFAVTEVRKRIGVANCAVPLSKANATKPLGQHVCFQANRKCERLLYLLDCDTPLRPCFRLFPLEPVGYSEDEIYYLVLICLSFAVCYITCVCCLITFIDRHL